MRNLCLVASFLIVGLAGIAQAKPAPKYYASVGAVVEADGVESGIVDDLKDWFVAELKSRPEFTLDLPADIDLQGSEDAVAKGFKRHGLRAFEMSVRVLSVKRDQQPPKEGKTFSTLIRGIRLSIFGQTIPGKVMAIGGDGAADVAVEIGRNDDVGKLDMELMQDAAKQSLKQAVDMTIQKLKLAAIAPKAKAKAKK